MAEFSSEQESPLHRSESSQLLEKTDKEKTETLFQLWQSLKFAWVRFGKLNLLRQRRLG